MQFLLLGVAVVMYVVWRAWTEAHGGDASPEGEWRSRTSAMSEHMERTNPGSTGLQGRYRWLWAVVVVTLVIGVAGAAVIIEQSGR